MTGLSPSPLLARGAAWQLPASLLRRVRGSRVREAVAVSGLQADLGKSFQSSVAASGEAYEGLHDLDSHLARLIVEDSLPTLLRYEDRNSMAFSIEGRVPFLDYRLVEYVFTRAPHLRIRDGWTKWIQRQAVDGTLPSDIVWRRDKVGFETPEQQWFRAGKSHLLDILGDDGASDYLDMDLRSPRGSRPDRFGQHRHSVALGEPRALAEQVWTIIALHEYGKRANRMRNKAK